MIGWFACSGWLISWLPGWLVVTYNGLLPETTKTRQTEDKLDEAKGHSICIAQCQLCIFCVIFRIYTDALCEIWTSSEKQAILISYFLLDIAIVIVPSLQVMRLCTTHGTALSVVRDDMEKWPHFNTIRHFHQCPTRAIPYSNWQNVITIDWTHCKRSFSWSIQEFYRGTKQLTCFSAGNQLTESIWNITVLENDIDWNRHQPNRGRA